LITFSLEGEKSRRSGVAIETGLNESGTVWENHSQANRAREILSPKIVEWIWTDQISGIASSGQLLGGTNTAGWHLAGAAHWDRRIHHIATGL
jgi:hypothetical protein